MKEFKTKETCSRQLFSELKFKKNKLNKVKYSTLTWAGEIIGFIRQVPISSQLISDLGMEVTVWEVLLGEVVEEGKRRVCWRFVEVFRVLVEPSCESRADAPVKKK